MRDWLLWQLADSAFPTGSFGHSGGLEAAWQYGEVTNRSGLMSFLEAMLAQLRHASLPFVVAAHRREVEFAQIDEWCDAFISNHVANRASRAQGRAFLASSERAFASHELTAFQSLLNTPCAPGRAPSTIDTDFTQLLHFAPVFGAVMAALEIDLESASRLFVYTQLRSVISAAVRLNILGPLEAQNLQYRLVPKAEGVAAHPQNLRLEDVAQTAPLLDLFQGGQDRLYSRLFQS